MVTRKVGLEATGVEMLEAMGDGASGMLTAATQLNDAIKGGGFSMSVESVQALITYTQGLQIAVARAISQELEISQTPKLGTTPAANTYTPYLPTIATNADQGLIPVLKNLAQQLDQTMTSLRTSLANYQQTEQANQNAMVNIQNAPHAI